MFSFEYNSQSSPINVVKSVIQARANGDWEQFSQLVIDGKEQYIWDGIVNCEGKNPNFQYEENITKNDNLAGSVHVWSLDDQSDVGDIDVKKLGDKWYVIGYWGGY